ncbi:MAG TPA: single-stranded DNA-binding protein [Candidatus Wolfebacteria bacterium]|nr:single-stranded DNA-binding protein [Candidatus Wolfebacteria bacterium]
MNLNKVLILGRLTADPQLRSTQTGQQVANFSIATNRVWKDKNGAKQEEVEYHNVVLWGRQAEIASQFLTKGSLALIEGRLRTRTWQDKQGQNRKTTEIICERLQLGPRSTQPGGIQGTQNFSKKSPTTEPADNQKEELPAIDIDEEDIKSEDLPF